MYIVMKFSIERQKSKNLKTLLQKSHDMAGWIPLIESLHKRDIQIAKALNDNDLLRQAEEIHRIRQTLIREELEIYPHVYQGIYGLMSLLGSVEDTGKLTKDQAWNARNKLGILRGKIDSISKERKKLLLGN